MPHTPAPPTLADGSVRIRPLDARDATYVLEQCRDPLVVEWTTVPVPYTPEMARTFCTDRARQVWADGTEWILALEHEGRYAGNLALRPEGPGLAEIAYAAHPDARGTGAMERGLRLLLDWGFTEVGLDTVVWRANVGNWASRKAVWRLGFSLDGVQRASHVHRGGLVDAWIGTLTSTEERRPRHPWLDSPELEGDGVRLRPLAEADVPRIVEACSDPRTQDWLGRMPSPYQESDARAHLESVADQQARGRGSTWAVTDHEDLIVGSVNLFDLTPEVQCEVGWWVHPDARGRGVATAAARRLVRWCFEGLGVTRVTAVVASGNLASRHVCEAVGMRHTGESRAALAVRGGRSDAALYDVLVEEWRSVRR